MSTSSISPYSPSNLAEAEAFAKRLANSPLTPDSLRGKPEDIFLIMATGHELGLSPMAAVRGLYVINNRIGIYSALAVSLVKRHGSCEHFTLVESTAQRATYKTKRTGESETTLTFTIEQARVAGYLTKGPWRATPEAMLRARAARALAEAVYPDALYGMPWDGDDSDEVLAAAQESKTIEAIAGVVDARLAANTNTQPTEVVVEQAAAPVVVPDPAAEREATIVSMLGRIADASTPAQLRSLGAPIQAQGIATEPRIRDAYASRHAQMRRAGGAR